MHKKFVVELWRGIEKKYKCSIKAGRNIFVMIPLSLQIKLKKLLFSSQLPFPPAKNQAKKGKTIIVKKTN
jgi:hypothetical protein